MTRPDRRIAQAWVAGVLAVGVALDVWLYYGLGNAATISQTVLWLSRECFLVPMLFGWLMGHLFWPKPIGSLQRMPQSCATGCLVASIFVAFYFLASDDSQRFLADHSLIPFAAGILFGRLFTPQTNIQRGSA